MKIVAVMPIKLNNERLPGKNLRCLGGRPLLTYSLKTLLGIEEINEIYVYCSSEEIVSILPNGINFLKRSQCLDLPESNFTQIFEAFSKEVYADVYVYAHATAPFVKIETIKNELNAVLNEKHDSAFCAEIIQDYLWCDGKPLNFDPGNLPRSQDLVKVFKETSGVYVFRKEVFDNYRSRVGINPYIVEVGRRESVDINTYEDFLFAEMMLDSIF